MKRGGWDEAHAELGRVLGEVAIAERNRIWNTLQASASRNAGADKLGRIPWPQAWLFLTPEDVLDALTAPKAR